MKKKLAVLLSIFLFCAGMAWNAFGQEMINRSGDNCPTNYIASGDSCLPQAGAKQAIAKTGSRCPIGFSTDGAYCYRPHKGTTKVIPRVEKQCPKGYWADGDYCQSFK